MKVEPEQQWQVVEKRPSLFELVALAEAVAKVNNPDFTREITIALTLMQNPPRVAIGKNGQI